MQISESIIEEKQELEIKIEPLKKEEEEEPEIKLEQNYEEDPVIELMQHEEAMEACSLNEVILEVEVEEEEKVSHINQQCEAKENQMPETKDIKEVSVDLKKAEESVDELQDFHINKKSSGKAQPNYTASELRAELISIFKKYDAYDEDPTSIFYENIISILKEKGFSGLRDCLMKDFNREKREKILRDISESSILRTLWSLKIQKSPIKALLVKEFKYFLKDADIDKYGDKFEKNGLKGLESLKKIIPDKEWRRLLHSVRQERLVKSEQIRAFLEDKIITFIDQSKITRKLEKSKGYFGKYLSDQIMEKGLESAVSELEGRFFKKKLKTK